MTAHTPPARPEAVRPSPRGPLLVLLVSLTVTGTACLLGISAADAALRPPLAWICGSAAVLLCTAVTAAAWYRERAAALGRRLAARERVAARFADETVPELTARIRQGAAADTALAAVPPPDHPAYRKAATLLAQEVGRGESSRRAAMSACANAAGRMQALATGMLADLRAMEDRCSDPAVLGDLLHLDHRTAQAGRLADSIAVLTGARSGRRWAKPIVMESVLRGAMGRIAGYQRIRLHSTSTLAVAGHAAEGVMHALAELLDNAANFSPPTAEVHVYVEEVPAGAIITVEDSGLVMSDLALRRAERAVSAEPLDLTALSGTRLGLAVVGCLARKHGLSVSFRPSARGGTGALVLIPQELVSRPQPEPEPRTAPDPRAERASVPAAAPAPAPERAHPPATARRAASEHTWAEPEPRDASRQHERRPDPAPTADPESGAQPRFSAGGLPKRRRGRTLAAARPGTAAGPTPPAGTRVPNAAESGARFGAFRSAVRGQGPEPDPAHPATQTPSASPAPDEAKDDTR